MAIDEKIISIDSDDDDDDYIAFDEFLQNNTLRQKSKIALEFEELGVQYLREIDKKKREKDFKKNKLIPYIIKHSKGKYGVDDIEILSTYSFEDIQDIYNETHKNNRSKISKFFHFLFNLE